METKKIVQPIIAIVFILLTLVVGVGVMITLSSRKSSTDSRSKAAPQDLSFTLNQREEPQAQVIDVSIQKDPISQDRIHSFSFTMKLETPQVLGLMAQAISKPPNANRPPQRTPHPAVSAVEAARCYNQVVDGKYWADSCKGVPGGTNCQAGRVELTVKELAWYTTWNTHGKPTLESCRRVTAAASSLPSGVTPSPTLAATVPATLLYNKDGITISTTHQSLVLFDEPQVTVDVETKTALLKISGKVINPSSSSSQQVISSSPLLRISLIKSAAFQSVRASLQAQSILGTKSVAPGAIIELLPKVVPATESAKASKAPCLPRPACLDATPSCLLPEPAEGWCSSPVPEQ